MLPIATSISPRRTPYANYLLIFLNILIFLISIRYGLDRQTGQRDWGLRPMAELFMLHPQRPILWQFITYAFLHANLIHILGNMYILYLFGNNVNDRLGNAGYLSFYLAGAIFSGLGHALLHDNPVLGASGAVAAVTGAYLVLFPNTLITVLYIFFFIGTIEIRALYFIAFKMIVWDNVLEPNWAPGAVAYSAHLAGYVFGILTVMGLFVFRLMQSDYNDLWSILRQWNRRRIFRDTVNHGYDSYVGGGRVRKTVLSHTLEPKASETDEAILRMRTGITEALRRHSLSEAADLYMELMEKHPHQVLARQDQLDVSNQLMSMGRWQAAADGYEKFLVHYPGYEHAEQVHLMLGILYGRYLRQKDRALEHLQAALDQLHDLSQVRMCREEMDRVRGQ
jgi:membrane associated rhomboid family serine protease